MASGAPQGHTGDMEPSSLGSNKTREGDHGIVVGEKDTKWGQSRGCTYTQTPHTNKKPLYSGRRSPHGGGQLGHILRREIGWLDTHASGTLAGAISLGRVHLQRNRPNTMVNHSGRRPSSWCSAKLDLTSGWSDVYPAERWLKGLHNVGLGHGGGKQMCRNPQKDSGSGTSVS